MEEKQRAPINLSTGKLWLSDDDINLDTQLTHEQFLASSVGKRATAFVRNEPWCSYRFKAKLADGTQWYLVTYFCESFLFMITLVVDAAEIGSQNWYENCSEKAELDHKRQHDDWLRSFGATPGAYAWGSIESSYDPKGACSSITLSYAENSRQERQIFNSSKRC